MSTIQAVSSTATAIHPATEVGFLSLTVSDLARSLTFYTEAIGLAILDQGDATATLGVAGAPLLLLTEQAGAQPWPRETQSYTGLYHFAILMPTRADLGRWLRHWLELGFSLPGQGDHLVSEALYLSDPDGNGIEIYRDRPRDEWNWVDGQVRMGTGPVDIRGLLTDAERAGEPWVGMPASTHLGHIHLQVSDIARSEAFYHDLLGFDVVARMPTALFISAGGYHHHIGMNTWHSRGTTSAPADMVGLRFYTIDLPDAEALAAVIERLQAAGISLVQQDGAVALRDPDGIGLLLRIGSTPGAAGAVAIMEALQGR